MERRRARVVLPIEVLPERAPEEDGCRGSSGSGPSNRHALSPALSEPEMKFTGERVSAVGAPHTGLCPDYSSGPNFCEEYCPHPTRLVSSGEEVCLVLASDRRPSSGQR